MSKVSPVTGHYVTVEVDGVEYKVFYLENGTGQPLVCQHTAGCHNHQWRGLLEDEEITANYRVIAYDLPRHGKSDPPENVEWWKEEYTLTADHYVNFIVALCDALELEDPIFMGSSFGGNVALQLALRRPDRFAGVLAVEGADYSPGFYLDWWQHPHANAAQVCASGVWDLMAPQSPGGRPLEDMVLLLPGLRGVQGRPVLLLRRPRSAGTSSRDRRGPVPRRDAHRRVRLSDDPGGQRPHRERDRERHLYQDGEDRAFPDEREPFRVPRLPPRSPQDPRKKEGVRLSGQRGAPTTAA
ncbi:alpha/beta hydrolase [Actinomadura madurae]|uniref:alpha/beta fold hydrolase n=1 Tax=Actinomadura madurae TaxID=1993 RepID=UPI002026C1D1|nr:alpha/beta hydrolase [Actinomadura madurae]URN03184.1 alpha/beta hydrolase [Actinomadura madurae]